MTTTTACEGYTHLHVDYRFMASTYVWDFNFYCSFTLKAVFLMGDANQAIPAGAFYYSPYLVTAYIPTTVKAIGLYYYYYYCYQFINIIFILVRAYAFMNCPLLSHLVIPDSVTSIGITIGFNFFLKDNLNLPSSRSISICWN